MQIEEHKLSGVTFDPTPNIRGAITPKMIVMHYTAGFDAQSAITTLKDIERPPNMRTSAHLVVDTDGATTQLAPFNIRTWHAGPSRYDPPGKPSLQDLNWLAIGIEIVNPGWLRRDVNGDYISSGGRKVTDRLSKFPGLIEAPDRLVGSGQLFWPNYPEAQLDAIEDIVRALLQAYPTIEYIVGHRDIRPDGMKTDPGPAFPMRRFQQLLEDYSADGAATPPPDVAPLPTPQPIPQAPAQRQAPPTAAPRPSRRPPPPPPLSQSRTIWGAVVAFLTGAVALIGEIFSQAGAGIGRLRKGLQEMLGFEPLYILLGLFIAAIVLIIFARIDDQTKRRRAAAPV